MCLLMTGCCVTEVRKRSADRGWAGEPGREVLHFGLEPDQDDNVIRPEHHIVTRRKKKRAAQNCRYMDGCQGRTCAYRLTDRRRAAADEDPFDDGLAGGEIPLKPKQIFMYRFKFKATNLCINANQ